MNVASSMRVSTRIQALVGLALLGLLVLCVTALYELKSNMLEERQDKLKSQVESAVSVLKYFQAQARDGEGVGGAGPPERAGSPAGRPL
ncbi:hypothetical protein [Zoogloea sp.]|uniref:hypothetical protein n=1 Tax=Zoogloea sp. TaxID=49181 RepID=UPI0035AEC037